jgi:hypothetical protein
LLSILLLLVVEAVAAQLTVPIWVAVAVLVGFLQAMQALLLALLTM